MTMIDAIARRWLTASTPELESKRFVQADYDELVTDSPLKNGAEALRLFRAIVGATSNARISLIPLLVFPLTASSRLLTTHPHLDRTLYRAWQGPEVPGFYLTRPDLWSLWDDVEEYRRPVELAGEALSGLVCYYRAWRDSAACEHGWEYSRSFYIRAHGRGYSRG